MSCTERGSSDSPDLFDEFKYSEDMDEDFRRIDFEAEAVNGQYGNSFPLLNGGLSVSDSPFQEPARDQKSWVVFHGKIPGIYDNGYAPILSCTE